MSRNQNRGRDCFKLSNVCESCIPGKQCDLNIRSMNFHDLLDNTCNQNFLNCKCRKRRVTCVLTQKDSMQNKNKK